MLKAISLPSIFSQAPKARHQVSAKSLARPIARAKSYSGYYLWASYVLIAVNAALLMSYFIGVNSSTTKGYEIKKLQTSITQFNEENKKLTIKISEKNSMASLQNEIASSTLVPAGRSVFVEVNKYTKR